MGENKLGVWEDLVWTNIQARYIGLVIMGIGFVGGGIFLFIWLFAGHSNYINTSEFWIFFGLIVLLIFSGVVSFIWGRFALRTVEQKLKESKTTISKEKSERLESN